MEGPSVGGVGLVLVLHGVGRDLDVHFSLVIYGKRMPPQGSLTSRKRRTCRTWERAGPTLQNPFLPGLFLLHGPNVNHYQSPSVTANLIDPTLVNVYSWLAFMNLD